MFIEPIGLKVMLNPFRRDALFFCLCAEDKEYPGRMFAKIVP